MFRSISPNTQPVNYTDSNLPDKTSEKKITNLFLLRSLELEPLDFKNSPLLTNKKRISSTSPIESLTDQDITKVTCENICKILDINPSVKNPETLEDVKYLLFKGMLNKTIDAQDLNTILEMTNRLPNQSVKNEFYKDICEICLRKNNVSNALDVIRFIKNETISSRLLNSLFLAMCSLNEFRKALHVTNLIDDEAIRASTLKNLSIEAYDSKSLSICLCAIDCIPGDQSRMKQAALVTLYKKFSDLKIDTKDKRDAAEYGRLAQQIKSTLLSEYR